MPREKCPDCGEYHSEITIPSWLEDPLQYMLVLAGPGAGESRIEAINEIFDAADNRAMSMTPMAHFLLHCAQGAARDAARFAGNFPDVLQWNEEVLAMLTSNMTHFVANSKELRTLALRFDSGVLPKGFFALATETTDDEWYKAVTRAHFYSVCLDMVSHDEVGSSMFAVMVAALIGNNSLACIRSRYPISDETAIARVELVTDEYRRVAVETLDAVISSFQFGKAN